MRADGENTHTLDRSSLLLRDIDNMRTRWQVFTIFALTPRKFAIFISKELEQCFGILSKCLCKGRVGCSKLLQQRLDHRWVLRHQFSQLLNLRRFTQGGNIYCSTCTCCGTY